MLSRAAMLSVCTILSLSTANANSSASADQLTCLATAIYFEARGEPESGQMAVGQVILNRAAHPAYPSTVCAVVYQNASRKNACQFSFACDGVADRVSNTKVYAEIEERARRLLAGIEAGDPKISASTHYHATSVQPVWSRKLHQTGRLGDHIFYRLPA